MTTPYWLFDLDNTLHHADAGIFDIINHHMTAYMAATLKLSHTEASHLRQQYWQQYGATLAGIRRHHPEINIINFLNASHPIEAILPLLQPMQSIHRTLSILPGHKIIFSNGPIHYVQALINAMKIQHHLHHLIGIDTINFHHKPDTQAYLITCKQLRIQPSQCIMVDDSLPNLLTAKALGMRTIWYGNHTYPQAKTDAIAADMPTLAKIAPTLLQTAIRN